MLCLHLTLSHLARVLEKWWHLRPFPFGFFAFRNTTWLHLDGRILWWRCLCISPMLMHNHQRAAIGGEIARLPLFSESPHVCYIVCALVCYRLQWKLRWNIQEIFVGDVAKRTGAIWKHWGFIRCLASVNRTVKIRVSINYALQPFGKLFHLSHCLIIDWQVNEGDGN